MLRSTVLPGIAALLLSAALAVPASAAQRVTPTIGAPSYPHGPRLANGLNDSNDMGAALNRGQYRRQGRSNAMWPDGRHREGEWRQAQAQGKAAAGTHYETERRDGKWRGRGTYTFSDGGRYEGEWLAGKLHGQGIRTWPDGNRYEGEFREGKRHGRGIYTFPEGDRYEGEWQAGQRHGRGT